MARNREPDRVPPDGAADRPRRARPADHPRKPAIARHLSAAQSPNSLEHGTVPGPVAGEVERQVVEGGRGTLKEALDRGDGAVEYVRRTRLMLQPGAPDRVRKEWREGRKNGDREDAPRCGREMDWSPWTGDGRDPQNPGAMSGAGERTGRRWLQDTLHVTNDR